MPDNFVQIQALFDAEFALNKQRLGARITCHQGCSQCCHQIFTIHSAEVPVLAAWLGDVPAEQRSRLRTAAEKYGRELAELRRAGLGQAGDGSRLACPALDSDGTCTIYPARPLLCRLFGVPILNEHKLNEVRICALNGTPGEEIDSDGLVERQLEMQRRWRAYREAHSDGRRLTVAEAILEAISRDES